MALPHNSASPSFERTTACWSFIAQSNGHHGVHGAADARPPRFPKRRKGGRSTARTCSLLFSTTATQAARRQAAPPRAAGLHQANGGREKGRDIPAAAVGLGLAGTETETETETGREIGRGRGTAGTGIAGTEIETVRAGETGRVTGGTAAEGGLVWIMDEWLERARRHSKNFYMSAVLVLVRPRSPHEI